MNEERLLKVLLAPHVSEKSTLGGNGYPLHIFKVLKNATKPEVKAAVEHLFKVKVRHVRMANVKGKPTRFGQHQSHRSDWKKAYVTLDQGQEIEIS